MQDGTRSIRSCGIFVALRWCLKNSDTKRVHSTYDCPSTALCMLVSADDIWQRLNSINCFHANSIVNELNSVTSFPYEIQSYSVTGPCIIVLMWKTNCPAWLGKQEKNQRVGGPRNGFRHPKSEKQNTFLWLEVGTYPTEKRLEFNQLFPHKIQTELNWTQFTGSPKNLSYSVRWLHWWSSKQGVELG